MARPHWPALPTTAPHPPRWPLLAMLVLLAPAIQAQPDAPPASQSLPQARSAATPGAVAALRLRTLAATCAACHGTEGRALPDSPVPGLAGLPAGALKQALLAFKSGARPGTVMPQLAKGYEDAQLAALADYFAALAPEPDRPAAPQAPKEPRP